MNVRTPDRIHCPGHLAWIRNTRRCLADSPDCQGGMEAHHVRENGNAGTGLKPGDDDAVPLCAFHHHELHTIGAKTFEARHKVDLDGSAAIGWRDSPHGVRYRAEQERKR